jgi:hypothetical protein
MHAAPALLDCERQIMIKGRNHLPRYKLVRSAVAVLNRAQTREYFRFEEWSFIKGQWAGADPLPLPATASGGFIALLVVARALSGAGFAVPVPYCESGPDDQADSFVDRADSQSPSVAGFLDPSFVSPYMNTSKN